MKNEDIYMLRCWKDSTDSLRFGIKDIKSGKSNFFNSLEALKKHLDSFENTSYTGVQSKSMVVPEK